MRPPSGNGFCSVKLFHQLFTARNVSGHFEQHEILAFLYEAIGRGRFIPGKFETLQEIQLIIVQQRTEASACIHLSFVRTQLMFELYE